MYTYNVSIFPYGVDESASTGMGWSDSIGDEGSIELQ